MPVQLGQKIVFGSSDLQHGSELWVSDGTQSGTHILRDIFVGPGSTSAILGPKIGNQLYFLATNKDGYGLWKTDGTESGTQQIFSSRDERNLRILLQGMGEYQGDLYLNVQSPEGIRYLAKVSDATGDVELVYELPVGEASQMVSVVASC